MIVNQSEARTAGLCLATAYLEYMERFELDIPTLIPQRVHDDLKVLRTSDIAGHDPIVCPVQQDLAK